jgi:hypothetical protein
MARVGRVPGAGRRAALVVALSLFALLPAVPAGAAASIHPGVGTGSVRWISVGSGPQPFTGSVEGLTMKGVATKYKVGNALHRHPIPARIPLLRWRGTLGGTRFNVGLALNGTTIAHPLVGIGGTPLPVFAVTGTFGSQPVRGTLYESSKTPGILTLKGSVGNLRVQGVVHQPSNLGRHHSAMATFTLTS